MRSVPVPSEGSPLLTTNPPPYATIDDPNRRKQPGRSIHLPLTTSRSGLPISTKSQAHRKTGSGFELILFAVLVAAFIGGYVLGCRESSEYLEWKHKADPSVRWIDLTPEKKCLSYERRMYQAKLAHVPDHTPGDEWCWTVPITINGEVYAHPTWCGIRNGEIYGQWYVDKNEPSCCTSFSILDNEETCVHGVSRTRRYFGKLENFNKEDWDNWRVMCATTPFKVHNLTFERPHQCGYRGSSWIGAWGTVDVHDETCPE